jgi:hypothetical protein
MPASLTNSGEMPGLPRKKDPLVPLGLTLAETAQLYELTENAIRFRIRAGTLPAVRVAARRWLILDGDHEVLRGEQPAGLATVAHAARFRTVLTVPDVAEALCLCRRTVEHLVARDELPSFLDELGRRLVAVSDFRAWLRDRRKPARWESQTRRRAS